jgi:3-oxoacyl-[acyl-carrier protein] reductase
MIQTEKNRPVALVTGGSRGIGAATAHAFAETGFRVIITHRDSEAGAEEVLGSLDGTGHRILHVSASDTAGLQAAAKSVASHEGRLDVLVNNAATTRVIAHDDLDGMDDEFFDQIMSTNVRGPFATIRSFRPLLEQAPDGVVINVSSVAARTAAGSNVAYSASKAALDNMTMCLARALGPRIRVISVAPGLVETHLTREWSPERRRRYVERTPLARLGTPEDIAHSIVAAATRLTFTTGAVISVDGGRPLA